MPKSEVCQTGESISPDFPLYLGTLTGYMTVVPEVAIYSIGAVASMIQVPAATLRTWEERYAVVQPVRSAGATGCTPAGCRALRLFAERVREGISPGDAHRLLPRRPPGNLPFSGRRTGPILILLAERDPTLRSSLSSS